MVIRRKVSGAAEEPEWKFYLSNAPLETPLATFVRVSGMRLPDRNLLCRVQGRARHGPLRAALLARVASSYDVGYSGPSLSGSRASAPEPERGGSCASRPRKPCPHQLRSPAWTLTSLPPSRAQMRLLLRVSLPQPVLDLPAALALIANPQRHNYAAYCSLSLRLLAQLQQMRR